MSPSRVAAALLFASACAPPTPLPATAAQAPAAARARAVGPVVAFPSRRDAPMRCGNFDVDRSRAGALIVRTKAGGVVFQVLPHHEGEAYEGAFCADLDGDGIIELGYALITPGAHCCQTTFVVSLGRDVLQRARWEGGSEPPLVPADVDGEGALELAGESDAIAELGDVPYAFAPRLPVVLALGESGAWTPRTTAFPGVIERARDQAELDLAACGDALCQTSVGEQLMGLALLSGDWPRVRARFVLPPDVQLVVDEAAPRLTAILRRRGEPSLTRSGLQSVCGGIS